MGHLLIMLGLVSRQVEMRHELLGRGTLWILLAGVVAGGVMWTGARLIYGMLEVGLVRDVVVIVMAGGAGVMAYAWLLHWARLPELAAFTTWLQQRIRRAPR